jgi:hypothetical protein
MKIEDDAMFERPQDEESVLLFAAKLKQTREDLGGRVREVNAISEREVIAVGRAIGAMVDMLRDHVELLESTIATTPSDENLRRAAANGKATLEGLLLLSQGALSSLQFQDVIAQALLRTDGWLWLLEQLYASHNEAEGLRESISAPSKIEIGGEKPIDHPDAGEVNLF